MSARAVRPCVVDARMGGLHALDVGFGVQCSGGVSWVGSSAEVGCQGSEVRRPCLDLQQCPTQSLRRLLGNGLKSSGTQLQGLVSESIYEQATCGRHFRQERGLLRGCDFYIAAFDGVMFMW